MLRVVFRHNDRVAEHLPVLVREVVLAEPHGDRVHRPVDLGGEDVAGGGGRRQDWHLLLLPHLGTVTNRCLCLDLERVLLSWVEILDCALCLLRAKVPALLWDERLAQFCLWSPLDCEASDYPVGLQIGKLPLERDLPRLDVDRLKAGQRAGNTFPGGENPRFGVGTLWDALVRSCLCHHSEGVVAIRSQSSNSYGVCEREVLDEIPLGIQVCHLKAVKVSLRRVPDQGDPLVGDLGGVDVGDRLWMETILSLHWPRSHSSAHRPKADVVHAAWDQVHKGDFPFVIFCSLLLHWNRRV